MDIKLLENSIEGETSLAFYFPDNSVYLSDKKGIFDLLNVAKNENSLSGAYAADKIVGRAAAFLYVRCKPKFLYAQTLSEGGAKILKKNGIEFSYKVLTPAIMNRQNTGICPMDDAVKDIGDSELNLAYKKIKNRANEPLTKA